MSLSDESPITSLSDDECWGLLPTSQLGRLAVSVGGSPDIFPVNYVVDGRSVVFRTAEGTKLLELTINSNVAFEADGWDELTAWSVVVRGTARQLERQRDILRADELPLRPWTPTLKYIYVRISPEVVTGRRIVRGEEPERYLV
ncbi:pyridoxamine 5'-phosphate oxidase family protein [Salinibacterium sp. dk2585]|uniref:pyridoxamine 5'-phosphate oxidase family protein n=1 Tax=unclassified Salinibacterium TaxID=2632331 RepID=UPI0011C2485A|nr:MULTISPECIES: pyridoxamine 5'-phosphate oxidase family protein [unclassified Salinibacterium]QEE61175.1 pyridoxamine 5'-phosphate oxidase family protein [Salinibacterium sp. dk2585]TXK53850.1 pyridoxamine 5'-phosphate oxidase family protein [Salinibacterium sp. dk5596]